LKVSALVDTNEARLSAIGSSLPGVHLARSTDGLENFADIAIVAVPHHLHTEVAGRLLRQGLHVLVEKPLATSVDDARKLIDAARSSNRMLSVGLVRRHYRSFAFVREVLDAGWIGDVRSFDLREGGAFGWPVASASPFVKEHAGGVLMDTGSHTLDLLFGWLGPFQAIEYASDARGGVEANCVLNVTLVSGVRGVVELSRTRGLRNTCVIHGEKGNIEVGFNPNSTIKLTIGGMHVEGAPKAEGFGTDTIFTALRRQFDSFAASVESGARPVVSAEDALESIRAFDVCGDVDGQLELPWEKFTGNLDPERFAGTRVLVLGGTGFLGGRVVETLCQATTAQVRVMVRDFSRLSSVCRYPIEVVSGDIGDSEALEKALAGCDYVINCTYGKGPREEQERVNVDAAIRLVRLAARAGIRRVVHTSTVSVYGFVSGPELTEAMPYGAPRTDLYAATKAKGEEAMLRVAAETGLSLAVIQPGTIYGPNAPVWTQNQLRLMSNGRVVLIDGGEGISNAIYVDDVISALLGAATADLDAPEGMLVSGPDAVTWREFFGAYSRMLGGNRTTEMSAEAIARERKIEKKRRSTLSQVRALLREEYQGRPRLVEVPALAAVRRIVRQTVPRRVIENVKHRVIDTGDDAPQSRQDPVHLPTPSQEEFYRMRAAIRYDKARRLIGYAPKVNLARGMELTEAWARWACLL
jgi:predicted dehydrogenase/nucleoside-diphosphate-sugar epimerase